MCHRLRAKLGEKWETYPATIYNSAFIRNHSSDSRHHLVACKNYYHQQRFSDVKLFDPIVTTTSRLKCQYAKCILFVLIGQVKYVVAKIFPFADLEDDHHHAQSMFRDSDIGAVIMNHYTLLRTINEDEFDDCIQVLDLSDIERQEQLIYLDNHLILVNHFFWSNVFSSEE